MFLGPRLSPAPLPVSVLLQTKACAHRSSRASLGSAGRKAGSAQAASRPESHVPRHLQPSKAAGCHWAAWPHTDNPSEWPRGFRKLRCPAPYPQEQLEGHISVEDTPDKSGDTLHKGLLNSHACRPAGAIRGTPRRDMKEIPRPTLSLPLFYDQAQSPA